MMGDIDRIQHEATRSDSGAGGEGMLIVETIARIRREFYIKGKAIKEIVRDLRVSRNKVRKVLRSGATSFEYEREVQPRPKLEAWRGELDRLLEQNAGKPARERLTLTRIFEGLRELGYEGGYDAVRRYAKSWTRSRPAAAADAYIPLSFAPGEAYQFDWSHEIVVLDEVTTTVKVAHVRLRHSRMLFARAYPRESQERACQLVSKQTNFQLRPCPLRLHCKTSNLTPHGHGFASERPVVGGGDVVATGVEGVVDGTVG